MVNPGCRIAPLPITSALWLLPVSGQGGSQAVTGQQSQQAQPAAPQPCRGAPGCSALQPGVEGGPTGQAWGECSEASLPTEGQHHSSRGLEKGCQGRRNKDG